MSVSRVRYIKQYFPITSYTYDPATSSFNILANSHPLFANVSVYLTSDLQYSSVKGIANVTSSNTFSVATTTGDIKNLTHYSIDGFVTGQTGEKEAHTLPRATGTDTIIQSYVTGTGGASYNIDVSLDKAHWITMNTVTHGSASGNTMYVTLKPGWAYMRPNVVSIGANTNLVIMTAE